MRPVKGTADIPSMSKTNENTSNGLARLMNEIIFSEESDEISKGSYLSHFEMYRKAMEVIGVSTSKIDYIIT